MHGKTSMIHHTNEGVFEHLDNPFVATLSFPAGGSGELDSLKITRKPSRARSWDYDTGPPIYGV